MRKLIIILIVVNSIWAGVVPSATISELATSSIKALISETDSVQTQGLQYIGIVEGKAYFAEVDVRRLVRHRVNDVFLGNASNRTDAAAVCAAANMTLATVMTNAQGQFLVEALSGYSTYFWLGAQEGKAPEMFHWDGTQEPVSGDVFTSFRQDGSTDPVYCLVFHSSQSVLVMVKCSEIAPWRTLCEGSEVCIQPNKIKQLPKIPKF